jgi:branched-chain amino acid aminotransferase
MGRVVYIDGVRFAPSEAKVSVFDRGFLYGDSVFETVRSYHGKLYALDEHIDRLRSSANSVGIAVPVADAVIAGEARAALQDAGNEESYVRVMLTRGQGPLGLDPALAKEPCRVVIVEPLQPLASTMYLEGVKVHCVQTVRASDAAHSAKLGNYLASALALEKARAVGAHEALVVNRDGLAVEGTTSNIFAVRAGGLVTPALEDGILAGITRSVVLEIAAQRKIGVRYQALAPAELAACDELFITSSIREILPVVQVDEAKVGTGAPGPVTRRLYEDFRRHVAGGKEPNST